MKKLGITTGQVWVGFCSNYHLIKKLLTMREGDVGKINIFGDYVIFITHYFHNYSAYDFIHMNTPNRRESALHK